jgi:hypothetical protein
MARPRAWLAATARREKLRAIFERRLRVKFKMKRTDAKK